MDCLHPTLPSINCTTTEALAIQLRFDLLWHGCEIDVVDLVGVIPRDGPTTVAAVADGLANVAPLRLPECIAHC